MEHNRFRSHAVATIALSLLAIAAVIGGCTSGSPAVVSTAPSAGATGVPTSPPVVTVTFDRPMIEYSVEHSLGITPSVGTAPPTLAWSEDGRVAAVTFPQPFAPNTTYTVQIGTSAKARNDAALAAPLILKFTTGAGPATGAGPSESGQAELTFTKDIKPLAEARCTRCHGGKMSDYDNIIAKKYVAPGDPQKSRYYTNAAGITEHPGGNVWKEKADLVKQWISAGAPR